MAAIDEILLITVGAMVLSTILARLVTNVNELRQIKEKTKLIREKSIEARKQGDMQKANEYSKEAALIGFKTLRITAKSSLISLVIFLFVIGIIGEINLFGIFVHKGFYIDAAILSPVSIPVAGTVLGWFGWYLLVAFASSLTLRKLAGLQ